MNIFKQKHLKEVLAALFLFLAFSAPALAYDPPVSSGNAAPVSSNNYPPVSSNNYPRGNCDQPTDSSTLRNPLSVCSIGDLIALLLHAAIIIGIPIAVLFIVWAGFKFILARGSPAELGEARANLIATLIGVAIFIGASLIANVIIATLQQLGVQGINPL